MIYKAAIQNDFRRSEIVSDIEHTEIKVWNIDLADSYPELEADEKNILRYIAKNGKHVSVNTITDILFRYFNECYSDIVDIIPLKWYAMS